MDNLTKGALGATILVALGAVGFAVSKISKSERDNLALREQLQADQKQREDDRTAELERKLRDSEAQRLKSEQQMAVQFEKLRAQMAASTASSAEERRIEEEERAALNATLADQARKDEIAEESSLGPLAKKIRDAASIGKINEVNTELGFVILGAGSANGIQPEKRFNVRRGTFVVGEIVIESVEDERNSIANIDSSKSTPGLTIRPGDEVIGHPIF